MRFERKQRMQQIGLYKGHRKADVPVKFVEEVYVPPPPPPPVKKPDIGSMWVVGTSYRTMYKVDDLDDERGRAHISWKSRYDNQPMGMWMPYEEFYGGGYSGLTPVLIENE